MPTAETNMIISQTNVLWYIYRAVQKNGHPVLFWDNFGNSAPILTILLLLQAEIHGTKRKVLSPTAPLLCDHIT